MLKSNYWTQGEVKCTCRTCWRSSDSSAGASSTLTLSLTFLYLRSAWHRLPLSPATVSHCRVYGQQMPMGDALPLPTYPSKLSIARRKTC